MRRIALILFLCAAALGISAATARPSLVWVQRTTRAVGVWDAPAGHRLMVVPRGAYPVIDGISDNWRWFHVHWIDPCNPNVPDKFARDGWVRAGWATVEPVDVFCK